MAIPSLLSWLARMAARSSNPSLSMSTFFSYTFLHRHSTRLMRTVSELPRVSLMPIWYEVIIS